jgi:RNA polymerase-interacting CarD/CdnL/TRCF family regulator
MRFKVGQRVRHPKWGLGIITASWFSKKSENYAVKFDKGGPVGFAEKATNDVEDLKHV